MYMYRITFPAHDYFRPGAVCVTKYKTKSKAYQLLKYYKSLRCKVERLEVTHET